MEQRNSVAIIIPTYNRSALLTRALRTVDSQSIENLRIIVVDDGSTDATPDVMSRLCRQDARIVYQQTDHVGVATARNVGLDLAKGAKYIGFLDSDDQWLPEHLKTSIAALEANPDVGLTFAQIQTIDDTGTWTPRRAAARDSRATKALEYSLRRDGNVSILRQQSFWRALLHSELCPHTSTVLIRACALGNLRFNQERLVLEDCELFLTLAKRESFAYIDAVHAIVSYQGDNLTGSLDLVSDHALARRKAVLEYCHWKLGLAENGDDERVLQAEAAREAYLLALGHATRSESMAARRFYAAAFRHRRSWAAAKGFIATTLPPTFYRRLSALRSRYTQFRRTSTADG